ncbi:hypothetical protein MPL3356_140169 [Mesorhizobium plurifarium]|uniref:Uncharacterized protein n=1 Tax=Mesorhizobium plurifarium TaxID=69974 RepID=A0A090DCY9_MESPL|nr:hypothetical protein MPL3356_140169 [Mesorhizobium plurifarium]
MRLLPRDLPDLLRIEREIRSACRPVVVRSNGALSSATMSWQAVLQRVPGAAPPWVGTKVRLCIMVNAE